MSGHSDDVDGLKLTFKLMNHNSVFGINHTIITPSFYEDVPGVAVENCCESGDQDRGAFTPSRAM